MRSDGRTAAPGDRDTSLVSDRAAWTPLGWDALAVSGTARTAPACLVDLIGDDGRLESVGAGCEGLGLVSRRSRLPPPTEGSSPPSHPPPHAIRPMLLSDSQTLTFILLESSDWLHVALRQTDTEACPRAAHASPALQQAGRRSCARTAAPTSSHGRRTRRWAVSSPTSALESRFALWKPTASVSSLVSSAWICSLRVSLCACRVCCLRYGPCDYRTRACESPRSARALCGECVRPTAPMSGASPSNAVVRRRPRGESNGIRVLASGLGALLGPLKSFDPKANPGH